MVLVMVSDWKRDRKSSSAMKTIKEIMKRRAGALISTGWI